MNVGQLKEIIKDVPDDTPIATFRANMEGSGYTDKYIRIKVQEMFRCVETRIDAFDYTPYNAEILSSYPLPTSEKQEKITVLVIE